ncbi:hypothetical protein, unlikely [Trypanosoma congolense IL3000]|uniref:Uncharacterized protein n=1 Tax=Trypanosoma congolense (strain IL3000) TaxID=1068625 RepID=F9WK04_TRYCI|nr:hypothetical protein, unlikely [Trypanosoma congolense IL3000]
MLGYFPVFLKTAGGSDRNAYPVFAFSGTIVGRPACNGKAPSRDRFLPSLLETTGVLLAVAQRGMGRPACRVTIDYPFSYRRRKMLFSVCLAFLYFFLFVPSRVSDRTAPMAKPPVSINPRFILFDFSMGNSLRGFIL